MPWSLNVTSLHFSFINSSQRRKPANATKHTASNLTFATKCQQEFEKDKQEDAERETMQKGIETAETVSCVTITWGIGVTFSLSGGDKETATE